jgi:hypothetical protein
MKLSSLFLVFATLFFSASAKGQCDIGDLQITIDSCNDQGKFYVYLNFTHSGTSEQFKVQGNGLNYGLFRYADLPVVLGPLQADCTTNYEFVVRDLETATCTSFINAGVQCCNQDCAIKFREVATTACEGNLYTLSFDLEHNAPNTGFDLYNNGKFYGYYQYADLPLKLEKFPSSTFDEYNTLVVCANDNPLCCDTIKILNPCVCQIYKIRTQVVDCNADKKSFSVRLNFKHQLTSDSFLLGGNSISYGTFAYKDLPISLKNLPFSPTREYEFLIVDQKDQFCFGYYELGVVDSCRFTCQLSNSKVEALACDDGQFYARLSFTEQNGSIDGFLVRGNGRIYDTLEYGETSYLIGPLAGDCKTIYEFAVKDLSIEGCSTGTKLPEPVCCELDCEISGLQITEFCEEGKLVAFDVDFEHTRTEGTFVLKINNTVIGTFPYSALPLKITQINFDLPFVIVKIFDSKMESCNLLQEYTFKCYTPPACKIYDVVVKASACNADKKFWAILKFKVDHPGNQGFLVKVNGVVFDTLAYGKDVYEIGPLMADCATLYKFIIQDFAHPDCVEDAAFTEKICCEECKLSNPVVSFGLCREGKFDLTLQFNHAATALKFNVKVNGTFVGTYDYSSLPITLSGLNERTAYEIIVWDREKESCRLVITIPAIECPSATDETQSSGIALHVSAQMLAFSLPEHWLSSSAGIFDLHGRLLNQFVAQDENAIDISGLPGGMYILQLQLPGKHLATKFIKTE